MAGEVLQQDGLFILQQDGLAILQQDGGAAVPAITISPDAGHTAGSRRIDVLYEGGATTSASNPFIIASGPGSINSYVQDDSTHCHFNYVQAGVSGTPTVFEDQVAVLTDSYSNAAVAPGQVTIGALSDNGNGTLDQAFAAPGDDGGSAILEYEAELSTAQTMPGVSSPITLHGTMGVETTGRVRAVNAVGPGTWSANSSPITPARTVADEFFIDEDVGDDENNGTLLSPWRTAARVNTFTEMPGDHFFFTGGQAYPGTLVTQSGTAGNKIYYGTYGRTVGAEAAISNPAIISCADADGIQIADRQHYQVDNFWVQGSGVSMVNGDTTSTGIGVLLTSSQLVTRLAGAHLTALKVSGCLDGIDAWTTDAAQKGWDGLRIFRPEVLECQRNGVILLNNDGDFASGPVDQSINCSIYAPHVSYCPGKLNLWCGSGVNIRNATDTLVEYPVAHDISAFGSDPTFPGGAAGIGTAASLRTKFYFWECFKIFSTPTDVDGCAANAESGARDWEIKYGWGHDCEGAGLLIGRVAGSLDTSGGISAYNVYSRNASTNEAEICAFNDDSGVLTLHSHNDCIYADGDAIDVTAVGSFYFFNDIIVSGAGFACFVGTPDAAEGCDYYARGGGDIDLDGTIGAGAVALAAWRVRGFESAGGVERGVYGDPQFLSPGSGVGVGFLPNNPVSGMTYFDHPAGSPVTDAGANLLAAPFSGLDIGLIDFHGRPNLYGAGYDIGHHEYRPPGLLLQMQSNGAFVGSVQ